MSEYGFIKLLWRKHANKNDENIREAIIGSEITDFQVKKIKGRKSMFEVIITTNSEERVNVVGTEYAFFVINPMKLRVKFK